MANDGVLAVRQSPESRLDKMKQEVQVQRMQHHKLPNHMKVPQNPPQQLTTGIRNILVSSDVTVFVPRTQHVNQSIVSRPDRVRGICTHTLVWDLDVIPRTPRAPY